MTVSAIIDVAKKSSASIHNKLIGSSTGKLIIYRMLFAMNFELYGVDENSECNRVKNINIGG